VRITKPSAEAGGASLCGRFPFRIGTTSYIIEAGILENLKFLAGRVGEVQLVLFETPELSNIPSASDVEEFKLAAEDADLAFTVHLPGDIDIGSPDRALRENSAERLKKIVGLTAPLSPICWVLHLFSPQDGETPEARLDRLRKNMSPLIGEFNSPRDLAIENIHRTFETERPIIEAFDTSACVDIGHLLTFGADVRLHLERWLPRCRNIHLHGVKDGRDHESLACLPENFSRELFQRLSREPGLKTVTMEIFGMDDFKSSAAALSGIDLTRPGGFDRENGGAPGGLRYNIPDITL
jgi:sugar phosphate isomerase/epimerase